MNKRIYFGEVEHYSVKYNVYWDKEDGSVWAKSENTAMLSIGSTDNKDYVLECAKKMLL